MCYCSRNVTVGILSFWCHTFYVAVKHHQSFFYKYTATFFFFNQGVYQIVLVANWSDTDHTSEDVM